MNWIKDDLRALDMTQVELGELVGIPQAGMSRLLKGGRGLSAEEAQKILAVFKSRGYSTDRITIEEGGPPALPPSPELKSNVRPASVELPSFKELPRDIPIFGTAECGDGNFSMDQGQIIDYARRTPGIANARDVFCLILQGDSMEPAMHRGDLIYLSEKRPAQVGRYVVLELHPEHEGDAAVALFKVLLRRTAEFYELRQFNPDRTFKVKIDRVRRIFRVLSNSELLGI